MTPPAFRLGELLLLAVVTQACSPPAELAIGLPEGAGGAFVLAVEADDRIEVYLLGPEFAGLEIPAGDEPVVLTYAVFPSGTGLDVRVPVGPSALRLQGKAGIPFSESEPSAVYAREVRDGTATKWRGIDPAELGPRLASFLLEVDDQRFCEAQATRSVTEGPVLSGAAPVDAALVDASKLLVATRLLDSGLESPGPLFLLDLSREPFDAREVRVTGLEGGISALFLEDDGTIWAGQGKAVFRGMLELGSPELRLEAYAVDTSTVSSVYNGIRRLAVYRRSGEQVDVFTLDLWGRLAWITPERRWQHFGEPGTDISDRSLELAAMGPAEAIAVHRGIDGLMHLRDGQFERVSIPGASNAARHFLRSPTLGTVVGSLAGAFSVWRDGELVPLGLEPVGSFITSMAEVERGFAFTSGIGGVLGSVGPGIGRRARLCTTPMALVGAAFASFSLPGDELLLLSVEGGSAHVSRISAPRGD